MRGALPGEAGRGLPAEEPTRQPPRGVRCPHGHPRRGPVPAGRRPRHRPSAGRSRPPRPGAGRSAVARPRAAAAGRSRRRARTVTGDTPTGEPMLDSALAAVARQHRAHGPDHWVRHLSRGAHRAVQGRLVDIGVLQRDDHRFLHVIPVHRTHETDGRLHHQLVGHLRDAVVLGQPASPETSALALLALAIGLDRHLFRGRTAGRSGAGYGRSPATAPAAPRSVRPWRRDQRARRGHGRRPATSRTSEHCRSVLVANATPVGRSGPITAAVRCSVRQPLGEEGDDRVVQFTAARHRRRHPVHAVNQPVEPDGLGLDPAFASRCTRRPRPRRATPRTRSLSTNAGGRPASVAAFAGAASGLAASAGERRYCSQNQSSPRAVMTYPSPNSVREGSCAVGSTTG